MKLFSPHLSKGIAKILNHAKKYDSTITVEKAYLLLEYEGIEIPGGTYQTKMNNLRALFAWLDPSVAILKRGRSGGICPAKVVKNTSARKIASEVDKMRKMYYVSDAEIHRILASMGKLKQQNKRAA